MSLALHGQNLLDEKNGYIGGRGDFESIMLPWLPVFRWQHIFLNLCSKKHWLMQFLAKFWASTINIKGMVALQTFRQSQNESTFQRNSSIF